MYFRNSSIVPTICTMSLVLGLSTAHADDVPLGAASNFAILYEGTGGHNLQITNVTVNYNIGVGGTGKVQDSGPSTVNGNIDFSAANTGQFSNNNSSDVFKSVQYSNTAVTSALNTVNSLNTALANLGNNIAISGTETINESSGELETIGGTTYRVFNVTSYSENNGNLVTINGNGSGDPVVFDFGSAIGNVNLGGDVALAGGLTDDQILWNFTSTGNNVALNNNASSYPQPAAFHGIILAPNDGISLTNASFDGRLFGGGTQDMQVVSGDVLDAPPPTTPDTGSTLILLGLALAGLGAASRKLKSA